MAGTARVRDTRHPVVRTRLVWGGLVIALGGVCAVGVGMMAGAAWLTWPATGATLLGLVLAWRGGVLHETRGQAPPRDEARELIDGGTHQGVSPDAHVVGADVQRRAAAMSTNTQDLLARARSSASPGMRSVAAFGLASVGAWLVVGQVLLHYPMTSAGQDNALRDAGFSVIVLLLALRLRMPSRSLPASALCLVSGGLLVRSALFLPHESAFIELDELAAGSLVVTLAAMSPF